MLQIPIGTGKSAVMDSVLEDLTEIWRMTVHIELSFDTLETIKSSLKKNFIYIYVLIHF